MVTPSITEDTTTEEDDNPAITAGHVLGKAGLRTLNVSELILIKLPTSRSRLVQQNSGALYACVFSGLEGLFRKDQPDTLDYGRRVCDLVKAQFKCGGFFTSDELPRYGLGSEDTRRLFAAVGKAAHDGHLVVLFAYDRQIATQIRDFLVEHFQQEIKLWSSRAP